MDLKQLQKEIPYQWRVIAGYGGNYEVNNIGQVRSLDRVVYDIGRGGTKRVRKLNGRMLKTYINSVGYPVCNPSFNGIARPVLIHRLVASAFILNELSKPEVNHKNGIKTDNRVENLEWVTTKENIQHAFKIGLSKNPKGATESSRKKRKITFQDAENIRVECKNGVQITFLSELYGIARSTIRSIRDKKTYLTK